MPAAMAAKSIAKRPGSISGEIDPSADAGVLATGSLFTGTGACSAAGGLGVDEVGADTTSPWAPLPRGSRWPLDGAGGGAFFA